MSTDSSRTLELGDVTSRTFLFLTSFRSSLAAEGAPQMPADEAARALQAVWREEEAMARGSVDLHRDHERAKKLLAICADELMRRMPNWEHAQAWPSQEAELYGTSIGGEEFFELIEDPAYRSPAPQEVAFQCLALGFQGMHAGDQRTLDDIRRKLRYGLDGVPKDQGERITPDAYAHTQGEDFTTMPVANSMRLFVVLLGVVLTLGLLAKIAYSTSVSELVDKTNEIAHDRDGLGRDTDR